VLNGCLADPSGLTLEAQPLAPTLVDSRQVAPARTAARARKARVNRTTDPHTFTFVIDRVRAGTLYRLAVAYPPNPCGPVFWRGPERGLVAGGTARVLVEGVAARTELEVRAFPDTRSADTAPDVRPPAPLRRADWLGADDLRFTDPAVAVRQFRWKSTLEGVIGGELQVAAAAFPSTGAFRACDEPEEGLLLRRPVAARPGEWAEIDPVDFGQLLMPRRDDDRRAAGPAARAADGTVAVDQRTFARLFTGAPLYVRVVPHTADGPACDLLEHGVAGWVMLARLPGSDLVDVVDPPPTPPLLDAGAGQMYLPPYTGGPGQGHPTYDELAFKVIEDHQLPPHTCTGLKWGALALFDPLGCQLVNGGMAAPGTVLTKGQWFYFTPQSSGSSSGGVLSFITGSFVGFATGIYNAAGFAVDALHDLSEQIKAAVAKVVLTVLNAVPGVDSACDAIASSGFTNCEKLVKAGIEYALTAAGAPPSIPNWEQLQQGAIEAVAGQIAEEIEAKTGLASQFTEDQLQALAEKAIEELTKGRGGSNPQYAWVIPYQGFEPPILSLMVQRTAPEPLPAHLYLVRNQNPLHLGAVTPLPTVAFPSDGTLAMRQVLQPNTNGIPTPWCFWGRFQAPWCGPGLTAEPRCFTQQWDPGPNPGWSGSWEWVESDCKYSQMPAIYYRDRWVATKYQPSPCVDLLTASRGAIGGLLMPFPLPPFLAFAKVAPGQFAMWDGPFHAAPNCY
jgi:hypothetical protein